MSKRSRAKPSIDRFQAVKTSFLGNLSNEGVVVTTRRACSRAISRTNSSNVAATSNVAEFAAAMRAFAVFPGPSNVLTSLTDRVKLADKIFPDQLEDTSSHGQITPGAIYSASDQYVP